MRRLIIILGIFLVLMAAVNFTAFAEPDTTNSTATTTTGATGSDISTGVPTVTSDTFVSKINSMANAIYTTARGVIPGITVVSLILGVVAMIILWDFRLRIGMILGGLIVVLWAPQIVGFIVEIAQF